MIQVTKNALESRKSLTQNLAFMVNEIETDCQVTTHFVENCPKSSQFHGKCQQKRHVIVAPERDNDILAK